MSTERRIIGALFAIGALSFASLAPAADEAKKPTNAASKGVATPPSAVSSPASTVSAAASETGLAAVYSDRLHGRRTASGQIYDRDQLTAAHKTLAFGTRVKITNVKNQKTVIVRINDRGPTQAGRILDISPRAAKALGIRPTGMAEVTADVVGEAPHRRKK